MESTTIEPLEHSFRRLDALQERLEGIMERHIPDTPNLVTIIPSDVCENQSSVDDPVIQQQQQQQQQPRPRPTASTGESLLSFLHLT